MWIRSTVDGMAPLLLAGFPRRWPRGLILRDVVSTSALRGFSERFELSFANWLSWHDDLFGAVAPLQAVERARDHALVVWDDA